MPITLLTHLQHTFTREKLQKVFPNASKVILFGEGYGPKIQACGQRYRNDVSFILFDVLIQKGCQCQKKEQQNVTQKENIMQNQCVNHVTCEILKKEILNGLKEQNKKPMNTIHKELEKKSIGNTQESTTYLENLGCQLTNSEKLNKNNQENVLFAPLNPSNSSLITTIHRENLERCCVVDATFAFTKERKTWDGLMQPLCTCNHFNWWLEKDSVLEIANALDIEHTINQAIMTTDEVVEFVKSRPKSYIAEDKDLVMEGVIARSFPLMLFRNRKTPIMFKLKVRDFETKEEVHD